MKKILSIKLRKLTDPSNRYANLMCYKIKTTKVHTYTIIIPFHYMYNQIF